MHCNFYIVTTVQGTACGFLTPFGLIPFSVSGPPVIGLIPFSVFVDLAWVARIQVPGVVILASTPLLFWPVLGLPRWRWEGSWIDRLGRAVGCGWIVVMGSAAALVYL
jgi:hypothetical protein